QAGHRGARGVAAGVRVVPATGVEAVPGERLDAGDARELGPVEGPGAHGQEPGRELVAPVGADEPARPVLQPAHLGDPGGEEGVVVEAVVPGDAPAVLVDLGALDVLLRGPVPGLLQ